MQYQMERRSACRRGPRRYDNRIQEPPFCTNAAGRSLKTCQLLIFTHLFIMKCITRFWDKNKPHLKLDNKIIQPSYTGTLVQRTVTCMGMLPPHLVVHVAIRHVYGYVAKSTPHVHGYVGARSGGQVVKDMFGISETVHQNPLK